MTFSPTSAGIGGAILGGGRKLGGMIDKRLDGANHVHAIAVQGMFNAHAQQQEHQHHLKSVRAAYKMAPTGDFTVRTGSHEIRIGAGAGAGGPAPRSKSTALAPSGGGHDGGGKRTPGEDHYENGVKHANGLMDTLQARMRDMQGAGHSTATGSTATAAEQLTAAARGIPAGKPMAALPAPRLALPAGAPAKAGRTRGGRVTGGTDVERVNGAIPMGNKSSIPDRSNGKAFEAHLSAKEAKHLADRKAALKNKKK